MNGELKGSRTVTPRFQDYAVAAFDGVSIAPSRQVAESRIADFCGGCDKLNADNVCDLVGSNDQGRYVDREWCGWASVDGVRGQMTKEGFIPLGSKSPSIVKSHEEVDVSPEGLARLGIENGRVETVQATTVYPQSFEIVTGEVAETTSEALARKGIGMGDRFSIDDAGPAVRAAILTGKPVIVSRRESNS